MFTNAEHFSGETTGAGKEGVRGRDLCLVENAKPGFGKEASGHNLSKFSLNIMGRDGTGDKHACAGQLW